MRPGPRSAKKRRNERVSAGGVSIVPGGFIVSVVEASILP
jgi:hypothetical protein